MMLFLIHENLRDTESFSPEHDKQSKAGSCHGFPDGKPMCLNIFPMIDSIQQLAANLKCIFGKSQA